MPPTHAEITSRISGWAMPTSRIVQPSLLEPLALDLQEVDVVREVR
jgi:hypothetical protein